MSSAPAERGSAWSRLRDRLDQEADESGATRGTLSLGRVLLIWLAANLVVTTMLTGTLFVPGISWTAAILMIVLGTLCGCLVLVATGNIGTRTGLATMALTRGSFGTYGSLLPVAANVIVLMGWSWVQAMLAGITVNYLVAEATGYSNPILFSALCQAVVVALAILGHEGLARVEPWLALAMLLAMAWVFYRAFSELSPSAFAGIEADPSLGMTKVLALDVVISTAVSWTVLSADINRLAQDTRSGVVGSGIGYFTSTTLAMILGATAIGYVVLRGDEVVAFDTPTIVSSFGVPLAVVIVLSVIATNTMVVYGMATTVVGAQDRWRVRFLPAALVLGLVSILGTAWQDLLYSFTDFLVMIGAFFVPVFAIMLVDYYVLKRGSYTRDLLAPRGRYWYTGGVNIAAVVVWVIGAATSYYLTYTNPSPVGATVPTFVLSAVIYLVWGLVSGGREQSPQTQVHLADQEDVR